MVASSILPIAIHKGKMYFLFGKENPMEDSAKGWSDFGGAVENDDSVLETAIRECSEELTGFLGNPSKIKTWISKQKRGVYKLIHNNYHIHITLLPEYDPMLPVYYNNNHTFLWNRMNKKLLNDTKLFEKIEIKWFSESDLRTKRNVFRSFYREKIDLIRQHCRRIKQHFQSQRNTRRNKHRNDRRRYSRRLL